ncbi:putative transmembrane protein 45B-like isoform X1 [Penaeus vannamei]|uniref:Putative transmembrane protein 45B-like isoform X1 n=1 Tax=Penaeus vannamei TaxID=6689 RepID=A0A3R7PMA7_PENVA|nr:putative transmembrane protein 45B-like isoform X1 [Penaeus vannamei]
MSCLGYAGRAACLLLLGTWWTYRVLCRYFLGQEKDEAWLRGGKVGTIPQYSFLQLCATVVGSPGGDAEGHSADAASAKCDAKFLLFLDEKFVIRIIDELISGWAESSIHSGVDHAHHGMTYFFFMLSGLADLNPTFLPDLDYVTLILATVMHAFSIFYDLHGRNSLDSEVHMMLFYSSCGLPVSTALEMCYKNNVFARACRSYFTLLQGTWYYQVWRLTSHPGEEWEIYSPSQQLVSLLFTWHVAGVFFLVMVCVACVRRSRIPEPFLPSKILPR